uniref:CRAL-TRIO domain-containing protein n=2 Tax=Steinernema glaseri TaxID=37863 RepID=A0A1I7YM32_9BILA
MARRIPREEAHRYISLKELVEAVLNAAKDPVKAGVRIRIMSGDHAFPTLAELSPAQKEQIRELRARTVDLTETLPDYRTDFALLRWLIAHDYDLDAALPKLRWALQAFLSQGLDSLDLSSVDKVADAVDAVNPVVKYFPGGLMGCDREGHLIYVQALARVDPRSISKAGKVTDLFRCMMTDCQGVHSLICASERKTNRKMGVSLIIDLEGFSLDLMYMPTIKIFTNLITLLQMMYPDMGRRIYVVNAPSAVNTVYHMIQSVLAKETRNKVEFLDSSWRDRLCAELGAENIFEHWGGTKKAATATGRIRMGGKVPESVLIENLSHCHAPTPKELKKLTVPARRHGAVPVTVPEAGTRLRWWFRCDSGDIDFLIRKDGYEVWPRFRTTTEFVPEFGEIECDAAGTYELVFDNGHGKLWSKNIAFRVETGRAPISPFDM